MTDYGVVVATHLAACDAPQPVRSLAEETQIPAPTVSKVLKALAKAGVVSSQRGVRGGYLLARGPSDTPVLDVIEALEGPIAVTECADDGTDASCEYEPSCEVRANWQKINLAVRQALAGISLADMTHPAMRLVSIARSSDEARARRVDPERIGTDVVAGS